MKWEIKKYEKEIEGREKKRYEKKIEGRERESQIWKKKRVINKENKNMKGNLIFYEK